MWYMHDVGWGWWLVGSLGMVAFWGLVIYGAVWLVRGASPASARPEAPEPPLDVLKRRLAGGEISLQEYETLRRALEDETRRPVAV